VATQAVGIQVGTSGLEVSSVETLRPRRRPRLSLSPEFRQNNPAMNFTAVQLENG
jgi:hypothetical protein